MIDMCTAIKISEPSNINHEKFYTEVFINDSEPFAYEMAVDMGKTHGFDKITDMMYAPFGMNQFKFMKETYPELDFIEDWKTGEIQRKYVAYCIKHIRRPEDE